MSVKLVSSYNKVKDCTRFQLGCSVGGKVFEGDSLRAIVDWLNDFEFREGYIDVVDTLQRHNLMAKGMDEGQAHRKTASKGQKWAKRNKPVLDELKMPYRVTHWDQWESDPRYSAYEQAFSTAFEESEAFRNGVLRDMRAHYKRTAGLNLEDVSARNIQASKRFYFGELAGLSIQFEDYACAEVYPGRELECSKVVRAGKVDNVPMGLSNAKYAKLFIEPTQSPAPKTAKHHDPQPSRQ